MRREWKPNTTSIKKLNDLSTLDITKLLGKLAEHENKMK